ncbi:MAG: hypothetical protein KBC98_00790 [Candidatus Pacebacteria bacterium]|nr:hypothetical protein [Candidatus Paceibacterota bacterium]
MEAISTEKIVEFINPETGEKILAFDGPKTRIILIGKIIDDLREKEALIVTNYVNEKTFKELVYVLDRGLGEDVPKQKEKLKPKDFEKWLLEKMNLLIGRLEITKSLYED